MSTLVLNVKPIDGKCRQTTANCSDTKQFPINHICLDSVYLFLVVRIMIAVQSTLTLKLKVAD